MLGIAFAVYCAPGTYNSGNGTCTQCPAGQYQNEQGKEQCISCPTGKWTASNGSDSQDDCLGKHRYHSLMLRHILKSVIEDDRSSG